MVSTLTLTQWFVSGWIYTQSLGKNLREIVFVSREKNLSKYKSNISVKAKNKKVLKEGEQRCHINKSEKVRSLVR